MILYKFKSLQNIEHALDIILNERLYCALYDKLNDPFEGLFCNITRNLPSPIPGLEYIVKKYQNSYKPSSNDKQLRICSLSSRLNDVRLWTYYADAHQGIAVKIDFLKESQVEKVNYSKKLLNIEDASKDFESSKKILLNKTEHWEHEEEYRIIQEDEYYPIKDKIKAIYIGTRISDIYKKLLIKIVDSRIPIYSTKINPAKVEIEEEPQINS